MDKDKKNNNKEENNNEFMINWAEDESPEHFAGDEQTDDFTDDNDYDSNLILRMTSPMGGPFMHPMHDATLDAYSNELDLQAKKAEKEKKK